MKAEIADLTVGQHKTKPCHYCGHQVRTFCGCPDPHGLARCPKCGCPYTEPLNKGENTTK